MSSKIKKLVLGVSIVSVCLTLFMVCFLNLNKESSEALGTEQLIFSSNSGVYNSSFQLTITGSQGATIYYTTDGSVPVIGRANTKKYSGPITVEDMKGTDPVLTTDENASKFVDGRANVQNKSSLERATIIRAMAVSSTGAISPVSTRTYFINNDISTKYKNCAVMSIVTDPYNLLDNDTGIYVLGTKFNQDHNIKSANFMQKGKDWERAAHMDFFDGGKTPLVSAGVGIRIHGGYSRRDQQKSFNVYFKTDYDYGVKKLEGYELIPGAVNTIDGTASNVFSSVMLRNGGNDNNDTKFVDAFIQKMVEDKDVTTQSSRPCMLYLNGEYWGLYNLTEKYSNKFLETEYGVNSGNVIIYKDLEIDEGEKLDPNGDALNELMALGDLDMTNENNYNTFKQMVDINSFTDYYATEVYICNNDWWSGCNAEYPHNNILFWKVADPYKEDASNKYGDGKWRYILYDTEWSMAIYGSGQAAANYDAIKYHAMGEVDPNLTGGDQVDHGRTQPNGSPVFTAVFKNPKFRMKFANTLLDIRNWNFESNRAGKVLDNYASTYNSLMDKHRERWNNGNVSGRVSGVKNFIRDRNDYIMTMLENNIKELSKGDRVNVTVTSGVSNKTNIKVNSIYPDTSSGWTGIYYRDYPISVKAEKVSGKKFDHWEVTGCTAADMYSSYTTFDLDDKNATIKAVYVNSSSPDTSDEPEEPEAGPRDLPDPTDDPNQPSPTPTRDPWGWNPTPSPTPSINSNGYVVEFKVPFKNSKNAGDKIALDISVQDAVTAANERIGKLNLFSWNSPYSDRREFGVAELTNSYPGDSAEKEYKVIYALKTNTAISIDGVVDNAWSSAKPITINNYIVKNGNYNRAVWATLKVMWDANNLYLLIDVTDRDLKINSSFSQSDAVELYFDENASDAANNDENYGANAFQYRIRYDGEVESELSNFRNYVEAGYNVSAATKIDMIQPGPNATPTPTPDPNATPTPTRGPTPTPGPTATPRVSPTPAPTKDPATLGYVVSFDKDSHATINVYKTQEYDNPAVKLTNVSSAKSMDSTTGNPTDTDGQVNFEIVCASGYVLDTMSVTPTANYKNLKTPTDTGAANIYRITKITGPVTVTIRTRSTSAAQTKYTATFASGEHFSITTYDTQVYSDNSVKHEKQTSAIARNSTTGEIDATGEGQINFMVMTDEGYLVDSVSAAPETNYKNLKGPSETFYENAYRITKVTGDITVTVKVKPEATPTPTPRPGRSTPTPRPGKSTPTPKPGTTAGPNSTGTPKPAGTATPPTGKTTPTPTAGTADNGNGKLAQDSYPKKVTIGLFTYTLTSDTTAKLSGCKTKSISQLTIPAVVKSNGKTYKIIMIDNNAFKNYKKLKKVVIGKNITAIGNNAFSGCKMLKSVVINSIKIKAIGKNAFKNTYKKLVIKVPKSKKKLYGKLIGKKYKVK